MEPTERIEKFLKVISRLGAVIRRENQMLSEHKTRGLSEIVDEKKTLSGAYEHHITALQEPGALDGVDHSVRERLFESLDSFAALLDENRTRVQAMLEASHRMFEIIADAVKDQQASYAGYGQSGTMGGDAAKAYRPALSVGLNQEY